MLTWAGSWRKPRDGQLTNLSDCADSSQRCRWTEGEQALRQFPFRLNFHYCTFLLCCTFNWCSVANSRRTQTLKNSSTCKAAAFVTVCLLSTLEDLETRQHATVTDLHVPNFTTKKGWIIKCRNSRFRSSLNKKGYILWWQWSVGMSPSNFSPLDAINNNCMLICWYWVPVIYFTWCS